MKQAKLNWDISKVEKAWEFYEKAWDFFTKHYIDKDSPPLARPSFQDVAKVRSGAVFHNLHTQIVKLWQARLKGQNHSLRIPNPAEAMKRFDAVGLASPKTLSASLWTMSISLFRLASDDHMKDDQKFGDHIQELMDMWKLCLTRKTPRHQVNDSPWLFVREDLIRDSRRKIYFDQSFSTFVSLAPAPWIRFSVAASALITYDLLNHAMPRLTPSATESKPYMDFAKSLETLFKHTTRDVNQEREMSKWMKGLGVDDATVSSFFERLESVTVKSLTVPSKRAPPESHNVSDAAQALITQLGRAVEKADLTWTERLWEQAQSLLNSKEPISYGNDGSVKVYEQFIIAFFKLRRTQSAFQVWVSMVQSGIQPTVRTWSTMLKGCHFSKDVRTMEAIWNRMRESGIKPDLQAWSTRIYGILRGGRHEEGLQALAQMGQEWLQATKLKATKPGNVPDTVNAYLPPKPDTAILNSALTALRSQGKHLIPRVLAWSRSFDIEADVITYNALLNLAMSEGQQEEAGQILKRMTDSNIKADSNTLTILINSMFYSQMLNGLSLVEQERAVMNFIDGIESSGVSVDEKGYSLLIDRLLKEHKNPEACQKVLSHMMKKRVQATPHIYTILMTYYFDQTPPDLYAIDALWNQIRRGGNNTGAPLDVIFFDRMLEGYARHGDVGRAMTMLTRMSKEGKRPGWLALTEVVRCLAAKDEWDRLVQIVLDCKRQEGLLSVGMRGAKGQAEFIRLIEDLGVLNLLPADEQ